MRRIIFLTYLELWSMEPGKGAPSFFKTVEAYVNDGWEVTLIGPNSSFKSTEGLEGINIITFQTRFLRLAKIRWIGLLGRLLYTWYGQLRLYQLAYQLITESKGFYLLYAYEIYGVRPAKKLARRFKLPLVNRFQGTIMTEVADHWINRIRRYPHFSALSSTADVVIMTNDGTQGDQLLQRLHNQSAIIKFWRNGVDITSTRVDPGQVHAIRLMWQLSDHQPVLITVCRLVGWKHVDRAITAMAEIVKFHPHAVLLVVGDGIELPNLIHLAKGLGISNNIKFIKAVPHEEIINYLACADIFLSLYDLSNIGNPLLEAMACGKAIITLDVGDTNTLITDQINGLLLNCQELATLPEKILNLLNDHSLASRLGNQAAATARNMFWSWQQRMAEELSVTRPLADQPESSLPNHG